jgi:tetratricopeptide (TPR) repeat protein
MSSQRDRSGRPGDKPQPTFWQYNEWGVCLYNRGCYDDAITELRKAVGACAFPLAVLHVNLGAAYLRSGMYREARESLEEGLYTNPDDQAGHVLLGQALLAMGETGAARTEFDRAWQLNPDSPEGRAAEEGLGRLYGILLR